jgi:glycosyltransferase involved in cell wall biosynthesis
MYTDRIAPNAGVVVPYGVDLAAVDAYVAASDRVALRAELGIPPSARLLLCLGTVEERKSPAMLAHAFLSSPVVRDSDLHLAIVGATANHYVDTLTRYLEEARTDRITLHPLDPDSSRWHLASDMLVSAADNESMPRTMIEAMAFGRPVAGTSVFGVPELVSDGGNGFLCEPRDVAAMRAMLERVASASSEELARMGANGRERVRREHDPRGYAEFFLAEVQRLDNLPT